jgi:hypothetical protein
MLAHEWRELEMPCEGIGTLRERLTAACRTGNTGLIEGLTAEMDRATRQRERLVRHISTQLGSAAADHPPASEPALQRETPAAGGNAPLMASRD